MNADYLLDDHFKIRLKSKKLASGNFQVRFQAVVNNTDTYGYLLVESQSTLYTVVELIRKRLQKIEYSQDHSYHHLYNLNCKMHAPSSLMTIHTC